MRILLDQCINDQRNKGNNSILEVELTRLRKFWPEASFHVISNSPYLCKYYFMGTIPVSPDNLVRVESNYGLFERLLPRSLFGLLFELREIIYERTGQFITIKSLLSSIVSLLKHTTHPQNQNTNLNREENQGGVSNESKKTSVNEYHRITNYDLYVATGGGYLFDYDKDSLLQMFDRVEAAIKNNIPTVMVGQGVGQMEDPEIIQRARQVLPLVDYIMIREERIARPTLDSFNVPQSKVIMTGDDAIELAYQARKWKLGAGIGLSLRVAPYTALDERRIETIRSVLLKSANKFHAKIIIAPIDVNDKDKKYTEKVVKGYSQFSSSWRKFELPLEVIKRISHCRIMISGTFHGAVFALGQGIPVVAFTNSVEYFNKLSGLSAEFGEGCQVINLADEISEEKLLKAIDFTWASADQLRPQLLDNAKRQIDMGNAAYKKIYSLLDHQIV
jgi:polysaccharide pyruvyl transferase WcaK-like protein